MVIDTEESFRSALAGNLRDDGHAVLECANSAELPAAAQLLEIPVLVTEFETVGENGLTLADRWHRALPAVGVIMVTAHWSQRLEEQAAARPFLRLLGKPLDYEDLHRAVHELADYCGG